MANSSSLKILKSSNSAFCHNFFDIEISIALFGNLICMGFISHENSQRKIFLVILIFKEIKSKFLREYRELLIHVKRKIRQE